MLKDSQREALLARLRSSRADAAEEIPRRVPAPTAPLSFGQEQLWFVDRFAPGLATYNIPCLVSLRGPLDQAALGGALDGLAERHEALRTRLAADPDGRPAQVIDPPGPVPVELADLSGGEPGDRAGQLVALIHDRAMRPFDLAKGPLLRCTLVTLGPEEHMLVAAVHHAVFDGWSAGVFVRDLSALYGARAGGEPAALRELPVQFADYSVWERGRVQGSVLGELESYWKQALDGFETLQFPTDRPRPMIDDFTGALAEQMISPDVLAGLRELGRKQGTTLYTTVMAALLALLHRYSGQDDLVVGTASANRSRAELAPVIGFLVNTLPIRCDLSGDPTFTDLMARVKEATIGAFGHQDLPFARLVETLGVARDSSRAPVFQIAMAYAERDETPVPAAGVDFAPSSVVVGLNAAKFDLAFATEARAEGLWVECCYKTALFDAATARRILDHYEALLRGVLASPAARLSQLPLLTEAELRTELADRNDTAATVAPRCVHELFEAQAARSPDAPAAEMAGAQVSYRELNKQANQVARLLRARGAGPEVLVGVCMGTSLRRLAVLLGILKAGAAYVPLDPAVPSERLAYMISDTGMRVVLTDDASASRVPAANDVLVLSLDAEAGRLAAQADGNLGGEPEVTPANVAYVLYTSSSTGQAKGVMIEHRNLSNFLHGMTVHWEVGPADTVLQYSTFTFDVSVMDMFMTLTSGAKLLLAAPETLHSPPRLAALLRDSRVTFAFLTPAVLGLLPGGEYPDLRILLCGGEELPSALARRWIRPGLRLVNGYGPTETTVLATYAEIGRGTPLPPPIGYPVWPNYQVYVLDPHLNPVPPGVVGELHVGGASVARGYLNRPDLTRDRFIADPFSGAPGARLYKTGDMVYRRPDGSIVFAGRADHQVKIHGVRIELGEIEAALTSHPAIAQAVLTVVASPAGDKELAAYLRPAAGADTINLDEVRAHLARTLPAPMIPAHLVTLADFPLNTSGKIDKKALPAPPRHGPHGHGAGGPVAPASLLEILLTDIYASLLDAGEIGATDSFFDLGGNSLQAMRLINMLSTELNVDVGASAVFLAPTPRQLAALLRDEHGLNDEELGAEA
ncbi:MAG TPA: amino acid adenylation domain-containing protein [Trebonia sp.]|jgi:amino acid adenylation domain-containing protein|nr:amino acid adenylation domain-containing protein [Trebonia sp.]